MRKTQRNTKCVVSLYVIEISLDLHTYFLKITSPMNLLDRSFLKQFKTFAVHVLS